MNARHSMNTMKKMMNGAEELVALTFEVCEERLASARVPLTHPHKALSAAAMTVRQAVETFLAVSQIPDQPKTGR